MQTRLAAMAGPHDVIDLDLHLRRETLPTWLDEQVRRRAAPAPRA